MRRLPRSGRALLLHQPHAWALARNARLPDMWRRLWRPAAPLATVATNAWPSAPNTGRPDAAAGAHSDISSNADTGARADGISNSAPVATRTRRPDRYRWPPRRLPPPRSHATADRGRPGAGEAGLGRMSGATGDARAVHDLGARRQHLPAWRFAASAVRVLLTAGGSARSAPFQVGEHLPRLKRGNALWSG